jgi:hypothetical protein
MSHGGCGQAMRRGVDDARNVRQPNKGLQTDGAARFARVPTAEAPGVERTGVGLRSVPAGARGRTLSCSRPP